MNLVKIFYYTLKLYVFGCIFSFCFELPYPPIYNFFTISFSFIDLCLSYVHHCIVLRDTCMLVIAWDVNIEL